MTSDRFPLPDEVEGPTPELGPVFRRRVLTQVRQARSRRRARRQLATVALVAVAMLGSITWLRRDGRTIPPTTSAAAHWNQDLESDLAWLEEAETQRSSSAPAEMGETSSADVSGARSLRYFFPAYQELSTEARN
jgi:hypothetical protein